MAASRANVPGNPANRVMPQREMPSRFDISKKQIRVYVDVPENFFAGRHYSFK
jgi:hypothetical protein